MATLPPPPGFQLDAPPPPPGFLLDRPQVRQAEIRRLPTVRERISQIAGGGRRKIAEAEEAPTGLPRVAAAGKALLGLSEVLVSPARAIGELKVVPALRAGLRAIGSPGSTIETVSKGAQFGTEVALDPATLTGVAGVSRRLLTSMAARAAEQRVAQAASRRLLARPAIARRVAPTVVRIKAGPVGREPVPVIEPLGAPREITIVRPPGTPGLEQSPRAEIGLQVPPPHQSQRVIFPIGGGAQVGKVPQTRDPQTILNRVVGGGVGDKIAETENVQAFIFAPRNVDMRQAGLLKLTDAEDLNLLQVGEGRARPITTRVGNIVAKYRSMDTQDAQAYVRLGARVLAEPLVRDQTTGALLRVVQWKPFRPIANHMPRMLDPRRVVRLSPQKLTADIQRATDGIRNNSWMTPQQAADVTVALRATALGQPIPATVSDDIVRLVRGQPFLPAHLHARTELVLPDSILRPMKEAIPIYLEQSAKERAFLQVFGASFDDAIEQTFKQIGPRDPHARLAVQVWDVYRGRFIEAETGRRQKQLAHILNNLATATLLGPQTAVSQISQFSALIGKFGLIKVARGMAKVVFQGGRLEAERVGTFINSLTDEVVRLGGLPPTATFGDMAERASADLARFVVHKSGIKAMDEFPRAVGFHAAKISILDAQRAAALGNPVGARMLSEVGLSAASPIDDVLRKSAELSRKLNVTANFSGLPFVLQTPLGSFARGLNTFNIQVTRMVAEQFVKPALRGNVTPLLKFLGTSLVLGEAIGETRRALAGRGGDRPGGTTLEFLIDLQAGRVPNRVKIARVIDELGWSGTLGIVQNMWQSAQFALSATEAGARLVGGVTGAGLSSAGEIAGGVVGLVRAPFAEEEKDRLRRLRTSGRIGLRRVPIGGGIVAPRVFRSAIADRRVAVQTAARALLRGDRARAARAIEEFERRHGKRISQEAIDKELAKR